MTQVPPVLLSPRAENIHVNHGWWCSDCTDELFEVESSRDFTAEWLEALTAWAKIAGHFCGELLASIAIGVVGFFIALAWIIFCWCEGTASDTRLYEKQLKERDGLEREERDYLNACYTELLAERQRLLKSIDQAKAGISQGSRTPHRHAVDGDFSLVGGSGIDDSPSNLSEFNKLEAYERRLAVVEQKLKESERDLSCAQMA